MCRDRHLTILSWSLPDNFILRRTNHLSLGMQDIEAANFSCEDNLEATCCRISSRCCISTSVRPAV